MLRATPSAAGLSLGRRAAWWWLCDARWDALLGLLVFGCFDFLLFLVECVEAGWLLQVSLQAFFLKYSWGPWEKQERHVRVRSQIFVILRSFEDPILRAFCVQMDWILLLVLACFQFTFCAGYRVEILTVGVIKTRSSFRRYCKNHPFANRVFS